MNWSDIANRALWTFAQAALAVLAAGGVEAINVTTLQAAGIAGLAALISLAKNIVAQKTATFD